MSMTDASFMMDVIRVDVRGVRPSIHPDPSTVRSLEKSQEKKKTTTKKKPI
jgi:hypothetical protein